MALLRALSAFSLDDATSRSMIGKQKISSSIEPMHQERAPVHQSSQPLPIKPAESSTPSPGPEGLSFSASLLAANQLTFHILVTTHKIADTEELRSCTASVDNGPYEGYQAAIAACDAAAADRKRAASSRAPGPRPPKLRRGGAAQPRLGGRE